MRQKNDSCIPMQQTLPYLMDTLPDVSGSAILLARRQSFPNRVKIAVPVNSRLVLTL